MRHLENFTEEERLLLIALPYRTGLWVSESDESGGDDADEAELAALECIVSSFAQDFCKTEIVEELMSSAVAKKADWGSWGSNLDNVLSECRQAVELLAPHYDYKEVSSFKHNLMEIAMAVAMAYREFDDEENLSVRVSMYGRLFWLRLVSLVARKPSINEDEILNVSSAEQEALADLAEVLKLDLREGLEPKYDFDDDVDVKAL